MSEPEEQDDQLSMSAEHDVLRFFREKAIDGRELEDEVRIPSTGQTVRMRLLSHKEMGDVQSAGGTAMSRKSSVDYNASFALVTRAITHIDNVTIEELTQVAVVGVNSLTARTAARNEAIVKLRSYLENGLGEDDVVVLLTHYQEMADRRQAAMRAASGASRKKSRTPSLRKASTSKPE